MLVGIVAQRGNRRASYLAADIRDRLRAADVEVWIDEETAISLSETGRPVDEFDACDLVVSIGGDGTFLFTARNAADTPILGVNLGEVGFLNAVAPEEAVTATMREVEAFRDGGMDVREAPRIAAHGDGWESNPAANEVVVGGTRRGPGGGLDYELRVDGSLYSGSHADGVLVATPTGSTAYNLSERGPLVHPRVDGLVVNEMNASAGMPPLLVDPARDVTVTLTGESEVVVVSDGRVSQRVDPPAEVHVTRADPPVRMAGPAADFFEALGKLA